jgi:acyl-CoA oxidase
MFRHRAARLIFHATLLLDHALLEEKLPYAEAWNKHILPLVRAARAHTELFVLERLAVAVDACCDLATQRMLTHLRNLLAMTATENPALPGAMGFVEDGYIVVKQLALIREVVNQLPEKLLPDLIALGDAWAFTDPRLGSAIGMYDGNIYERLLCWTKQLPLNV